MRHVIVSSIAACCLALVLSAPAAAEAQKTPPAVKACQKNCGDPKTTDPTAYETCMNQCADTKQQPHTKQDSPKKSR